MTKIWAVFAVCAASSACAPGYMKASDLAARDQGPASCAKSCEEIGMRMTALVLVGDEQPGCVCQPVSKDAAPAVPAAPAASPAAPAAETPQEGAAASTTGYVVIAAAHAARAQAARRQHEQQYRKK